MRRSRIVAAALAAIVMLGVAEGAGAAPSVGGGTGVDLSGGWGSAKACLVWTQGGVVECFASAHYWPTPKLSSGRPGRHSRGACRRTGCASRM